MFREILSMGKGIKGSLLDKRRFKIWDEEKVRELEKLTLKKAIALTEDLLSSRLIYELKENFLPDRPLCLRLELKRRRDAPRKSI